MTLPIPLSVQLSNSRAVKHIERELRSLSYRSVMLPGGGGFASATFGLDRPLSMSPDELAYYSDVDVYSMQGGGCMWCGRLEDPGRGVGADGQIWDLAAVGGTAHLRDRTVPLVYVDKRIDSWQQFSSSIKSSRWDTQVDGNGADYLQGVFQEGVAITTGDDLTLVYRPINEAGATLGRVRVAVTNGVTDVGYNNVLLTTQGAGSTSVHALNWSTTTATLVGSSGGTNAIPAGDHTAFLRFLRDGANETATKTRFGNLQNFTVMVRLLNADGTTITTGYTSDTLTATQIVNDMLGRILTEFDGANATIATTSFGIEQFLKQDGTDASGVLEDLALLEPDYKFEVWDRNAAGKYNVEYTQWPTTVDLEAGLADGYTSTGSSEGLYNAVSVVWRDGGGKLRRTRVTSTVPELDFTREARLNLQDELASSANATQIGTAFLNEHAKPQNQGQLTIARPIYSHSLGRSLMPWELPRHAPGKLIRLRDVAPSTASLNATAPDGVSVFKVVGATFDTNSAAAVLDLDSQPRTVEHLLARASTRPGRRQLPK
jgi:hypothetical protein